MTPCRRARHDMIKQITWAVGLIWLALPALAAETLDLFRHASANLCDEGIVARVPQSEWQRGRETDYAAETTTDRDYANQRNLYKVELWTKTASVSPGCYTTATELMRHAPCSMRPSSIGRAGATPSASGAVCSSSGRSGSEAHSRAAPLPAAVVCRGITRTRLF
jgi:hypothetical protein